MTRFYRFTALPPFSPNLFYIFFGFSVCDTNVKIIPVKIQRCVRVRLAGGGGWCTKNLNTVANPAKIPSTTQTHISGVRIDFQSYKKLKRKKRRGFSPATASPVRYIRVALVLYTSILPIFPPPPAISWQQPPISIHRVEPSPAQSVSQSVFSVTAPHLLPASHISLRWPVISWATFFPPVLFLFPFVLIFLFFRGDPG